MKNIAIRTFVIALAVVGFSASSMYARNTEAKTLVTAPSVVSTPTPLCLPGHGTCGMD